MKAIHLIVIIILGNCFVINGQSIFKNDIIDTNPSSSNPYTNGQVKDPNITVSGIGRGTGLNGNIGGNRYNARDWNTAAFDPNDYFEFTITPNSGYKIDFINFTYKAQVSAAAGPINFIFRTSLDGFTNNVSTPLIANTGSELTPTPINLSSAEFQNITTSTSFRMYAWGGTATTGTFSINEFDFKGNVSCNLPTPSIGIITQPNCDITSGTIILKNLPSTGTYDLFQNEIKIISGGSGNSTSISGLSPGTYQYKIGSNYCQSKVSPEVIIYSNTSTWNGISWSNGLPNSNNHIVFNDHYSSSNNINCCSCQINLGNIVIQEYHNLTITKGLNVIGGSLTFENNSSLIQLDDTAINSGIITYRRQTTDVRNVDYTYWSSPVEGFTIGAVSPLTLTGKWYSYNATIDNWKQESATTIMDKGIGYIIRGPETNKAPNPPSTFKSSFIGKPNNGIITIPVDGIGHSNLIGNPYPSAIEADKFIIENNHLIEGTIYFWTHNTSIQLASNITNGTAGSGSYTYTSDDYASYNLTGGVAAIQTPLISGGSNTEIPTGKITAGQGFFITCKKPGSGVFKNNMRLDLAGNILNNTQFFKSNGATKTNNTIQKNRIWLNLTNSQAAFKQLLVGYITGATNSYESTYDGETFNNNPYLDFYSQIDTKKLTIQGRALPFSETDRIPLGYTTTIEGEFTISIDKTDGLFTYQDIFLNDKLTNTIKDLNASPYVFTTKKGTFNDRFAISYINPEILSAKDFTSDDNGLIISSKDTQIKIQSVSELINSVLIFDCSGKLIREKNKSNSHEVVITNVNLSEQLLFVKILLKNGKTITKKIIY